MAAHKHNRVLNGVLMVIFLALTLALPVRNMVWPRDAVESIRARGGHVFNEEDVRSSATSFNYITLGLFGSLTLVFGWRALGPGGRPGRGDDAPVQP